MWNPPGAGIKPVSPVMAGTYPLRHQGSPKLTALALIYKSANNNKFPLLGSKITVDGDCSHEIRRRLLLGRKTMTNLDSVLKSRVITLPTKVHIVKAMVFPVVPYGCESWTVKKAECQRIDAFELWCWKRLLKVPWVDQDCFKR